MSRAEYMREYRTQRKAAGDPLPSGSRSKNRGRSGQRLTKFDRAEFIAWDGEGINDESQYIDSGTVDHRFTLFANSVGSTIHTTDGTRLSTLACFDLLLDTSARYPHAIHVIYGGSYDMNHILHDLPRETAAELAKDGSCMWNGYYIQFHQRRSLLVKKGNQSITLWDVIGFFQMRFEKAVSQWLGEDYEQKEIISEGKKRRTSFQYTDMDFMQSYNDAELRALVRIMERFHEAVSSLDLTLSRWDGAGAVASAILTRQGFKQHLGQHPRAVEQAARHAYFGGRFELGQYGIHEGKAYGYDINSAYPTVFCDMPSLAMGRWSRLDAADPDVHRRITSFSLVRVEWSLPGIRFGPFPYRDVFGLVTFPEHGANWVWGVEYLAWLNTIPDHPSHQVTVTDAWIFTPNVTHSQTDERPFAWVQHYYQTRQAIVQKTSSLPYGAQMVLKLGLNSLYGKTAQSLGYDPGSKRLPPFHSLLYAGFITASTRAKLWLAAMQAPDAIVMMATDGIISTVPLHLPESTEKVLGAWEATEYDLIAAIQSGVYVTKQGDTWSFRQRGLDNDSEAEVFLDKVYQHWSDPKTCYTKLGITQTRMIGIKTAVRSDNAWNRWGCWHHSQHELIMHPGPQTKRIPDENTSNSQPHLGLVATVPTPNVLYEFQGSFSVPYERPWDRESWAWSDDEELQEVMDYEYA